jgi:hypothetical protein
MEHFFAQHREIVRGADHHIEWRVPQVNQVEGAGTLLLGEATDISAR